MNQDPKSRELVEGFIDGTLDEDRLSELKRSLQTDPALRASMAMELRMRALLRAGKNDSSGEGGVAARATDDFSPKRHEDRIVGAIHAKASTGTRPAVSSNPPLPFKPAPKAAHRLAHAAAWLGAFIGFGNKAEAAGAATSTTTTLFTAKTAIAAAILATGGASVYLIHQNHQQTSVRSGISTPEMPETIPADIPEPAAIEPQKTTTSRPRVQSPDAERFLSGLNDLLHPAAPRSADHAVAVLTYLSDHGGFLATASTKTSTAAIAMITAGDLGDHHYNVAIVFLVHVAKGNPAWAIARLDETITAQGGDDAMEKMLKTAGKMGKLGILNWTPEYAFAFEKWLNAAQSVRRLAGLHREVAAARFDISVCLGDLLGATRYFDQLTSEYQIHVAADFANTAQTPGERRRMIEQAANSATPPAFREIIITLARESGSEAFRDMLAAADITPESRDLAAAIIASTEIENE